MFDFFPKNNSESDIKDGQIISYNENNENNIDLKYNIELTNKIDSINDNDDESTEKLNPEINFQTNKTIVPIKKRNKYNFTFFIKIILLILFFLIVSDNIDFNKIDLNNYLNKIYGEEDLLKLIEEKKQSLLNPFLISKKKIENDIEDMYKIIEKIKQKKSEIISKNKKIVRDDGKLILNCAYSTDNKYMYPTLVSITSLCFNSGNNTFYNIHILLSPDFKEEYKHYFMSVEKNYTEHCKINFINMGNKYEGKDTNHKVTTATYYRLDLHNLLPDVDRIIYMDGDTAIFQDLSELIFLDMKGNYILGFLDGTTNALEIYNIKNAIVICAGVILMDLDALRKNNISEKFNEFIESNLGKLYQHDQTTINYVCHGKISSLPPKYGMWNFPKFNGFLMHNLKQAPSIRYNKKELSLAYDKPGILHYTDGKPFFHPHSKYYLDEWWEIASKTGQYKEIKKFSE